MKLTAASSLLSECVREELGDYPCGKGTVFWWKDKALIAEGYFNGDIACVWFVFEQVPMDDIASRPLRYCGTEGNMPEEAGFNTEVPTKGTYTKGLTKEEVFDELTNPPRL